MGFFNKLKNMFFEEEVVDSEPESLKNEIVTPKEEENIKKEPTKDDVDNIISERELFKSETTFKFPVIFEEEDFNEEKKINKNKNVIDFETIKIKEQQKKETKEPPKVFRPSPIISPVYGILDKNYSKEDIITKENTDKIPVVKEGNINFDVVRKKAYGSLSDEIEQVLEPDDNKGMFFNLKPEDEKEEIDDTNLLYDMSDKGEDLLMKDITIGSAEQNYEDFGLEYSADREVKELAEVKEDDNLFDLIDSMYADNQDDQKEE